MKPLGAPGLDAKYPLQSRGATDGYTEVADSVVLIVGIERANSTCTRELLDSMVMSGVRLATVENWADGAGCEHIGAIFLMSACGPSLVDVQRRFPGTPIVRMQGTN